MSGLEPERNPRIITAASSDIVYVTQATVMPNKTNDDITETEVIVRSPLDRTVKESAISRPPMCVITNTCCRAPSPTKEEILREKKNRKPFYMSLPKYNRRKK